MWSLGRGKTCKKLLVRLSLLKSWQDIYVKSGDNLSEPLQDPHSGTRMPRLEKVHNYEHYDDVEELHII